jgi:hypothetical protein
MSIASGKESLAVSSRRISNPSFHHAEISQRLLMPSTRTRLFPRNGRLSSKTNRFLRRAGSRSGMRRSQLLQLALDILQDSIDEAEKISHSVYSTSQIDQESPWFRREEERLPMWFFQRRRCYHFWYDENFVWCGKL